MTTPQKPRAATSSEWTFNHRARPRYLSDSDSSHESDVDANPGTKPVGDDAHLLREMDLSGRHETVEYRPNPWSIARINAASRPLPKPALVADPSPAIPLPESKPKPIVEAFKKLPVTKGNPRRDQPIIRDVGIKSRSDPGATVNNRLRGGAVAKKSRQGCESMTPQVQRVRICPQRSEVPGPPLPAALKPQTGSVLGTLQKEKPAHISNFSNRSVEPPAFRLFQPRRILSADPAEPSSRVHSFTRQGLRELGNAIRNRSAFHHSSPGVVSRNPILADTVRRSVALAVVAPPCTNSWSGNTVDFPSPSPPPHQLGSTSRGTEPSWPLNAIEERIDVATPPPHLLTPTLREDPIRVGSSHARVSEPRHKRMASPRRTPPSKKPCSGLFRSPDLVVLKPPTTSASRRRPDAYKFGEDHNPDAEWSTLARTKRRATMSAKRAENPMGIKQSGCFTLPLLVAKPKATPARALDAKPRVITYLPPPMKLVHDTDNGPPSKNCEADEVATEGREDEEAVDIRIMDSDVTLVNEDEEDIAVIDVDDVCVHYPKTRACMKTESRLRKMLGSVVELQL